MTKEELERIKTRYQPIHSKNASVIPPNAGSHVRMKENGYIWKDLDKAWWEGFDNAKNKMEKRIADLEKENAELRERLLKVENAYKRKSESEWRLTDLYQKLQTDYANAEKCSREYFTRYRVMIDRCVKAEGIIRKLLDVLTAIDGEETKELKTVKEAEQFLNSEVEK